ncbi:unnamed protein product, partial [Mesorhabditis belari]|uniref:Uncharacterized protein n=1 Tax=Mesorhabditis belari TaxID=2138241 RepID=A0AAF3ED74_9BILA
MRRNSRYTDHTARGVSWPRPIGSHHAHHLWHRLSSFSKMEILVENCSSSWTSKQRIWRNTNCNEVGRSRIEQFKIPCFHHSSGAPRGISCVGR